METGRTVCARASDWRRREMLKIMCAKQWVGRKNTHICIIKIIIIIRNGINFQRPTILYKSLLKRVCIIYLYIIIILCRYRLYKMCARFSSYNNIMLPGLLNVNVVHYNNILYCIVCNLLLTTYYIAAVIYHFVFSLYYTL